MKQSNDGFLKGRLRAIKFALRGVWFLITTEDSIKTQIFFSILVTFLGFYFHISKTEWMFQLMVIGLILASESLNTAVEKLSDFIHPSYHKKIGFIKDIAAGAPAFASIIGLIVSWIIYAHRICDAFF